ncbi:MAG: hypothetical protein LUE65_01075 [Clostridiales bacterium]|nr:hypothetical protein [Clostridiales bacterium]MCD8371229.1 hypothetical protein [Clostridiales bacterium]
MSNRDYAKTLIDQVPESKLLYAVYFLQGMIVPDETPNAETLEAIAEVDNMIEMGAGQHFSGSTEDFLASLLED